MTETEKHKDLKKLAHLILYKEGFKESEITEEYFFRVSDSKSFRIDVVGISENKFNKKQIAIELGNTNPKKLAQLELFFDKVIHIPYGIEGFNDISIEQMTLLKKDNETLESKIEELNKILDQKDYVINDFEKDKEYDKQVTYALRVLRAVQTGLVKNKTICNAIDDSKNSFCSNYPYDPEKPEKDNLIENLYKILFNQDGTWCK